MRGRRWFDVREREGVTCKPGPSQVVSPPTPPLPYRLGGQGSATAVSEGSLLISTERE